MTLWRIGVFQPTPVNIKVFTQGGKVTLLGLVHSLKEKKNGEAKAKSVAGPQKVGDKLDVVN